MSNMRIPLTFLSGANQSKQVQQSQGMTRKTNIRGRNKKATTCFGILDSSSNFMGLDLLTQLVTDR